MTKRLLIFFLYDKDGIVDDYAIYFLNSMRQFCSEIMVVVNGFLSEEGKSKLNECSNQILIRENKGFDSYAYKTGIESYGYEKIKEYDELILANFTMFGPIFPLNEMFEKMDNKKYIDLWGITKHPSTDNVFAGIKVKEHIQSNFLVFRKSILSDDSFKEFWTSLKQPTTYEEAVGFYELRATDYFEKRGFKSDCYINLGKYFNNSEDIYFYYTYDQVKNDRIPFIKRRIFSVKKDILEHNINGGIVNLLNYLEEKTNYNVNLIYNNVKRCYLNNINVKNTKNQYIKYKIKQFIIPLKWNHYAQKQACAKEMSKFIEILKDKV